jgi:hypothetical protein
MENLFAKVSLTRRKLVLLNRLIRERSRAARVITAAQHSALINEERNSSGSSILNRDRDRLKSI